MMKSMHLTSRNIKHLDAQVTDTCANGKSRQCERLMPAYLGAAIV